MTGWKSMRHECIEVENGIIAVKELIGFLFRDILNAVEKLVVSVN